MPLFYLVAFATPIASKPVHSTDLVDASESCWGGKKTAVIKKTDTTKGDRLPCDHFRVHTTTDENLQGKTCRQKLERRKTNLQFQLPYSAIFEPLVRGDKATTFHFF